MNIVLGGAQIGSSYGLFNKKNFSNKEISKIEKILVSSNIRYIDTAPGYGKSQEIIGNSKLKNLKIMTKIKLPPNKKINLTKFLSSQISLTLKKLKKKRIYAILIHDFKDLLSKNGQVLLNFLKNLKKKKIVKKIGVSIYSPNDLKKIWKFWKPDIVQAPLNVIDQRILKSGWISKLKKNKIKIVVRSCFLQGILINNYNHLKISKNSKNNLISFFNWCEKKKFTKIKVCIDFIRQFKTIDFLVIGFDDSYQLEHVLKILKTKINLIPRKFKDNNINLIDPRKWN